MLKLFRLASIPALFRRHWRVCVGGATGVFVTALLTILLIAWLFPVPLQRLNEWPMSPVVTDRTGQILCRQVAADGQWRLPISVSEMSPWLLQATIAAEDARFESHPGIDGIAVLRAVGQNASERRVVSGASTLSMQLCRMLDDRPRTLFSKMVDGVRAVQLEQQRSKSEIIEAYLNLAPYGGNIRGVEAASLLYFDKHAKDLSLGEAALLAGIPQQPSRLRPDAFFDRALKRREYVLRRMLHLNMISSTMATDALEMRPQVQRRLQEIPTQVARMALQRRPLGGQLTIDSTLQSLIERATLDHKKRLPTGTDIAVVVIDIASSEIRTLVGSADPKDPIDGQVNGAIAKRSPGSALKPFLYAAAFETQRLAPDSIVIDDPQQFAEWAPNNFDREFAGRLTAAEALRASRNIPAIQVAQALGLDRCIGTLEACGLSLPTDSHQRGGLTLAVGGIEVTLLELTNAYATLGRRGEARSVRFFKEPTTPAATRALSANVCDAINDILSSHRRHPAGIAKEIEPAWFMWKTGTSSGRRDAWAIGHNHRYAIGVWVGNFSGTGHHDYVGKDAAEPLLSKLFNEPSVRSKRGAFKPTLWEVTEPLPVPNSTSHPIAMTTPRSGQVFVATDGRSVIHPRLNRDTATAHWFLNERFLGTQRPERLELEVGSYELRCVTPEGALATTQFRVE